MSSSDLQEKRNQQHIPGTPQRRYALLLGLLLLLLGLLLVSGSGTTSSGRGGSTSGGGTTTGTDGGQHGLDVLSVKSLGEEGGPDGFNFDLGGGSEGDDLVTL
jgi:hypothetical protein